MPRAPKRETPPPTQTELLADDIAKIEAGDQLITIDYLRHRFRRPRTTIIDAVNILCHRGLMEQAASIRRSGNRAEIAWRIKEV